MPAIIAGPMLGNYTKSLRPSVLMLMAVGIGAAFHGTSGASRIKVLNLVIRHKV